MQHNILFALIIFSVASGAPLTNKDDSISNNNADGMVVVKRQAMATDLDSDAQLKLHIPLQGLIDDLETSLFKTALSVGGIARRDDYYEVPEVTPLATLLHRIARRSTESSSSSSISPATMEAANNRNDEIVVNSSTEATAAKILIQTTARVAQMNNMPAHILIDRVAVQPHFGGVPMIPSFEVITRRPTSTIASTANESPITTASHHHFESSSTSSPATSASTSKVDADVPVAVVITTDGSLLGEKTKWESSELESSTEIPSPALTTPISSSKTQLPTSTSLPASASTSTSTTTTTMQEETSTSMMVTTLNPKTTTATSSASTSTTATSSSSSSSTSTTTNRSIEQLKEAEEELREKVAEIEAEPIILSARV